MSAQLKCKVCRLICFSARELCKRHRIEADRDARAKNQAIADASPMLLEVMKSIAILAGEPMKVHERERVTAACQNIARIQNIAQQAIDEVTKGVAKAKAEARCATVEVRS